MYPMTEITKKNRLPLLEGMQYLALTGYVLKVSHESGGISGCYSYINYSHFTYL